MELAKNADVSHRLVQQIESGDANPTLDSLHHIAVAFKVTIEELTSLSHIRIIRGDKDFLKRYSQVFKSQEIGVGIRTLNGIAVWANKKVEKIHGSPLLPKGDYNLLDSYSLDARGVLKNQISAERSGYAHPYTIAHVNPTTKETLFLRCYPTLIMPNKGNVPLYTSVYITEMHEDCAINYYHYCTTLLGVIYER